MRDLRQSQSPCKNAADVARVVIRPIAAMSTLVYPIGRLCTNLVNAVFAVFNIKIAAEPFVSEEELKLVLCPALPSLGRSTAARRR